MQKFKRFASLFLSMVMLLTITFLPTQLTLAAASSTSVDSVVPDSGNGTWTPPVGAENTWYLKDQLIAGNYSDGDPLVQYNASNPGIFSASFLKPEDGFIKVNGDQGNQYVELGYTIGVKDRGCPALVMDLPETVTKGIVVANFEMLITNGTSWDWLEAGIGTDCLRDYNLFAEKVIFNGSHTLETSTGWKSVGSYTKGQWYRYVLTADLSMQTMTLDVYAPGDVETPSQHASYPMGATKEAKRFIIKPILSSTAYAGAILIKDAAVSYVPAQKTPTLLTPGNDAFMVPLEPVFTWSSTGADSYTLEISKTADFSEDVITIPNLTQNTYAYTMNTELDQFVSYYWRVTSVFTGDLDPHTSLVFNFVSDINTPADNIYNAGDFGLIEGDWDTWPAHPGVTDVPRRNAVIIQALLDKAGRSGGGTVVLPKGTYCISGDTSIVGDSVLTINYDNITLTGQGKDTNGEYKTKLETNYKWDGPNGVFRSTGITIEGEPYGAANPRQNIEISHFELNGGRGWNGRSDWGYDPTVDYGWDIHNQGIVVSRDKLVTHVTLDDLFVHSYSGETVYVGGKSVGYLEVKNCILADTNASCFNLYAAYLNVHDNQFGTPDTKCRFWIEYCARASDINYEMPPVPAGLEKDHAYFRNNKFYNAVNAHGVAIAQGDCTTYTMLFENNLFNNKLSSPQYGLFQFAGSVYGPTIIRNNTIQDFPGPLVVFDYGGGTVPVDNLMNKNIYFEGNNCTNVGGPFISLVGTWGIWDPVLNKAVPALQPVENLVVRNNYFEGSTKMSKSVAISNSWDMIESAVVLKGVEISNNIFKNCTTPEELRVFVGNLPLFFNNQYIDAISTEFGGISNISPDKPQIKPVYESLVVNATSTVHATMRTGKNENAQQVTITGGLNTAPVVFLPTEKSIEIQKSVKVGAGDSIVFKYDTAKEKWIFNSFTKAHK